MTIRRNVKTSTNENRTEKYAKVVPVDVVIVARVPTTLLRDTGRRGGVGQRRGVRTVVELLNGKDEFFPLDLIVFSNGNCFPE